MPTSDSVVISQSERPLLLRDRGSRRLVVALQGRGLQENQNGQTECPPDMVDSHRAGTSDLPVVASDRI